MRANLEDRTASAGVCAPLLISRAGLYREVGACCDVFMHGGLERSDVFHMSSLTRKALGRRLGRIPRWRAKPANVIHTGVRTDTARPFMRDVLGCSRHPHVTMALLGNDTPIRIFMRYAEQKRKPLLATALSRARASGRAPLVSRKD